MSPCSRIAASTKLFSQGAIELQLDVGRDFHDKSDENQLRIGSESEFPPKSAGEALLGAFWQRFSRFLATWGRFWVTFSLPGAPQASPGGPWHVPGRSRRRPGTPQERPKSTSGGKNRTRSDPSRPKVVQKLDSGAILVDFWSILVDFDTEIRFETTSPKRSAHDVFWCDFDFGLEIDGHGGAHWQAISVPFPA